MFCSKYYNIMWQSTRYGCVGVNELSSIFSLTWIQNSRFMECLRIKFKLVSHDLEFRYLLRGVPGLLGFEANLFCIEKLALDYESL